eukprot:TRINITY_DN1116_c0_g1_i4.p1 TRINITY_DN1116_c0_g1~~TRINITY_DN1116_c0_g1_i4.p1  ORF type:complete len:1056 (+),score=170.49 TRINITY_DN1116_c0_g1_i4:124-3291(+)
MVSTRNVVLGLAIGFQVLSFLSQAFPIVFVPFLFVQHLYSPDTDRMVTGLENGGRHVSIHLSSHDDVQSEDGERRVTVEDTDFDFHSRVYIDEWGVPHITAASEDGLYVGLGYMHGRDRLFQLDLLRLFASGTARSVLGEADPSQEMLFRLEVYAKVMEFGTTAKSMLETDPKFERIAAAYSAGVNEAARTEPVPFEFGILGHTWKPWTPMDTARVMVLTSFGLMKNWEHELARLELLLSQLNKSHCSPANAALTAKTKSALAVNRTNTMWSFHNEGANHSVSSGISDEEKEKNSARYQQMNLDTLDALLPYLESKITCGSGAGVDADADVDVDVDDGRASIENGGSPGEVGNAVGSGGSNNWALSGQYTGTGKGAFSMDPHLKHSLPGLIYLAHLRLEGDEVNAEEGYEVIGGGIVGLPAIVFGGNGRVAWGPTANWVDSSDVYVEKTLLDRVNELLVEAEADHDSKSSFDSKLQEITLTAGDGSIGKLPQKLMDAVIAHQHGRGDDTVTDLLSQFYMTSDASVRRFVMVSKTFDIKNVATGKIKESRELRYRTTIHGPVLNDVMNGRLHEDYPIVSLKLFAKSKSNLSTSLKTLYSSDSVRQAVGGLSELMSFQGHWLLSDHHGGIAYTMPCRVPNRTHHVGTIPSPGWVQKYDWGEDVAVADLPSVIIDGETAQGKEQSFPSLDPLHSLFLHSANNHVFDPSSYSFPTNFEGDIPHRAQRIGDILKENWRQHADKNGVDESNDGGEKEDLDVLAMFKAMHRDNMEYEWVTRTKTFFTPFLESIVAAEQETVVARAARTLIDWDGAASPDSVGTTIYTSFQSHLLKHVLEDEAHPTITKFALDYVNADPFIAGLMRPDNPAWCDVGANCLAPSAEKCMKSDCDPFLVFDRVFRETVGALVTAYTASNIDTDWSWGKVAPLEIKHAFGKIPLIKSYVNREIPTNGTIQSVNKNYFSRAGMTRFPIQAGPVVRFCADFSRWQESWMVIPGGQSGRPASKHYDDQLPLFVQGDGVKLDRFGKWDEMEENSSSKSVGSGERGVRYGSFDLFGKASDI